MDEESKRVVSLGPRDSRTVSRLRVLFWLVFLALFATVVYLYRVSTAPQATVVTLYAYSTLHDVMEDGILPAFRDRWEREKGQQVDFVATYAASGEIVYRITRQIPAEVAVFSSRLDAQIAPVPWEAWKELPHGGVLARSPIVILVREGNPRGIRDFSDLGAEGVALLHPDMARSGAANLSILAVYGAALRESGDSELAFERLLAIAGNTTSRPPSARQAHLAFDRGEGDALMTYEQDVLGNPSQPPRRGTVVYPRSTIVAEPIVTRIEKNIEPAKRKLIDGFLEFLWSEEAQAILVSYGFHSVLEELDGANPELGVIAEPFTLEDLGGAAQAKREILEGVWKKRVMREVAETVAR